MNVLVYEGPGVSEASLKHTLITLKAFLTPNYAVQTVKPLALALQPWTTNCALLVIPGGRDVPYLSALSSANDKISEFVRAGGRYLGICAGAYYACRRVEWEVGSDMQVVGDRPLRFFNGIGEGCVYPGFRYENENGACITRLSTQTERGEDELVEGVYYNGGGHFVNAEKTPNTTVIAKYLDEDGEGKAAAVSCRVGQGVAVLWMVHPEFTLSRPPASLTPPFSQQHISEERLRALEDQCSRFIARSLQLLGLELPSSGSLQAVPLPQFLVYPTGSAKSLEALVQRSSSSLSSEGGRDKFDFYSTEGCEDILNSARSKEYDPEAETQTHQIILCANGYIPPKEWTPHFNILEYLSSLAALKGKTGSTMARLHQIGENFLYGEVIPSTQTQLDQNPQLVTMLPIPLVSLASYQLSGRGRGSNSWVSSTGGLQFSILLRLPLSSFPASKLVFVQYLFALAVVEACRGEAVLGRFGDAVKLKWPNDIYASFGEGLKKIGGVLVTTSFGDGQVSINIGCGLNVLNRRPMFSLSRIVETAQANIELSLERAAASIIATFELMWNSFVASKGSFEPFLDLYLTRWLHSDQTVTLMTTDPPTSVTIVGITTDYGFLRTVPTSTSYWSPRGEPFIDLQPDGNSFDIMAGLIRVKNN